MGYKRPGIAEMSSQLAFRSAVIEQQSAGVKRGARSSLSMSGDRQLNAPVQTISDILQGTLAVRNPQDPLLTINKALSTNLDYLYKSDYSTISAFSSAKYVDIGGLDYHGESENADVSNGAGATGSGDTGTSGNVSSKEIFNYLIENGVSKASAAGILANIQFESNFNTLAVGDGGTSGGLFQHHSGRWSALKDYAESTNRDWTNWQAQVDYALKEAREMGLDLQMTDPAAMAREWCIKFERPTNPQSKAAERAAVAASYMDGGNSGIPSVGSTATASGTAGDVSDITWGNSGNTVDEILAAGRIIADHPNNRMAGETRFRAILTEGAGDSTHCRFKTNKGGLFFPSILNYLYLLLSNGFIIQGSGSLIENRVQNNGTGNLSNHATGGGVDIFKFGYAPDGSDVYGLGHNKFEAMSDKVFTFLSTLPKSSQADEHGWVRRKNYGNQGFHTYQDSNPNHFHFGFTKEHVGSLLPALKKK